MATLKITNSHGPRYVEFHDEDTALAVLNIIGKEWEDEHGDGSIEFDGRAVGSIRPGLQLFAEVL